jgi:hypothetical protein
MSLVALSASASLRFFVSAHCNLSCDTRRRSFGVHVRARASRSNRSRPPAFVRVMPAPPLVRSSLGRRHFVSVSPSMPAAGSRACAIPCTNSTWVASNPDPSTIVAAARMPSPIRLLEAIFKTSAANAQPHYSLSRSANSTKALRYLCGIPLAHHLEILVPSPNGAPAPQPLTFNKLAVEASTSGTLWRRSTWPLPS